MAIPGPGSDRPAALGPAAPAEDGGACFFDFREECRVFAAGEKSRRSRCGKAIEAVGRPSGLISHSRLRWTRALNELTEITMAPGIATAQGHGLTGRTHADKRASTAMTACWGKRKQMSSHPIARHLRRPQRDPPKDNPAFEILQLRRVRRRPRLADERPAIGPSPVPRQTAAKRNRAHLIG